MRGGVGSWARVTDFERAESNTLYSVTVPKLRDMVNEEAQATMRQRTAFEVGFSNAIVVRCEFVSQRPFVESTRIGMLRPARFCW